jgi:hypothetical protein
MVRARNSLAIAALVAAISLCSCEFLGLDMFPSDLKNLEASFDLGSYLASNGVSYNGVGRIERLTSSVSGTSYVFVLLNSYYGRKLVILDESLSAVQALRLDSTGLGTLMLADNGDYLVCGYDKFSASGLTATNLSDTTLANESLFGYPGTSANFVVSVSSYSALDLRSYAGVSSAWGSSSSTTLDFIASTAANYDLIDLLYTGESSRLAILMRDDSNAPWVVDCATPAAFAAGTANAVFKLPSDGSDRGAWLTSDGIVTVHSNSGPNRLVRYAYGSGAELDSLSLNVSTEGACISFDPEGRYYFRYDSLSGRLYKLRTWWK